MFSPSHHHYHYSLSYNLIKVHVLDVRSYCWPKGFGLTQFNSNQQSNMMPFKNLQVHHNCCRDTLWLESSCCVQHGSWYLLDRSYFLHADVIRFGTNSLSSNLRPMITQMDGRRYHNINWYFNSDNYYWCSYSNENHFIGCRLTNNVETVWLSIGQAVFWPFFWDNSRLLFRVGTALDIDVGVSHKFTWKILQLSLSARYKSPRESRVMP